MIELAGLVATRGIDGGMLCNSVAAEALTSVLIAINRRYKVPGAGIRITGLPRRRGGDMSARLVLTALEGMPLVAPGDDLGQLLVCALRRMRITPQDADIVVVAQKIVSKAEGRVVNLASVVPSERALAMAAEVGKDPRLVELILGESSEVVRRKQGRADRRAPPRLRDGQRRGRSVERGPDRRRRRRCCCRAIRTARRRR